MKTYKHNRKENKRVYMIWAGMKQRCYNENNDRYKNYGGRGIKVCERWINSFDNFFDDMGERPNGTSIDRINNNGDYCPENCKWSTSKEQGRNKTTSLNDEFSDREDLLDYQKKTLRRKRDGVCYRCKQKTNGKMMCESCCEKAERKRKTLCMKRKLDGKCSRCNKVATNGTLCEYHDQKQKSLNKKLYHKRKASGKCLRCKSEVDSTLYCEVCRQGVRAKERENYWKNKLKLAI